MFAGLEAHPADDVYALAIVTYKLLTGVHPYQGLPAPEARKRNLTPKRPAGLRPYQWLVLRRGLAFERQQRPADAGEFLRRWQGRRRLLWLAASTALISILAVSYIVWERLDARLHQAPAVSFDALPKETRREIETLMSSATVARQAGEQEAALRIYEQAYQLHPRSRWVTDELEDTFEVLVDAHLANPSATPADRMALLERLQKVMDTDRFLGNQRDLLALREQLQQ